MPNIFLDEVGSIGAEFRTMKEALEKNRAILDAKIKELENANTRLQESEKKLQEKIAEFEKIQKLTMDRELKMAEMKKTIEALEGKITPETP